MYLRKLETKDAPLMLEWMHDESVVAKLAANFAAKTIDDCRNFIAASQKDEENLHLAVADGDDTYMGTVSLKHIDRAAGTAEFAITVRTAAMGKGFSHFGMDSILKMGISELGLSAIYWCVSPKNARAVRFYDKHGYTRITEVPVEILSAYPADMELIWYIYQ
ncbi:MAG: GNAT family N-acetyltransferase [Ruminococcaceae bacterium]|nr:GNAT family N-acetyltransferase [Oscillospiraceae bacterium]